MACGTQVSLRGGREGWNDPLYAKMFILELVGKFTPVLPRVETVCG